jgi:hypothetical protein
MKRLKAQLEMEFTGSIDNINDVWAFRMPFGMYAGLDMFELPPEYLAEISNDPAISPGIRKAAAVALAFLGLE